MSLFGIIFYILIIIIFIHAKKAAQSESGQKGNISNVSQKKSKTIPNVSKSRNRTIPNVPKSRSTTIPNVPRKKKMEKTFMEPHREEQHQPKTRTNNLWGGRCACKSKNRGTSSDGRRSGAGRIC